MDPAEAPPLRPAPAPRRPARPPGRARPLPAAERSPGPRRRRPVPRLRLRGGAGLTGVAVTFERHPATRRTPYAPPAEGLPRGQDAPRAGRCCSTTGTPTPSRGHACSHGSYASPRTTTRSPAGAAGSRRPWPSPPWPSGPARGTTRRPAAARQRARRLSARHAVEARGRPRSCARPRPRGAPRRSPLPLARCLPPRGRIARPRRPPPSWTCTAPDPVHLLRALP